MSLADDIAVTPATSVAGFSSYKEPILLADSPLFGTLFDLAIGFIPKIFTATVGDALSDIGWLVNSGLNTGFITPAIPTAKSDYYGTPTFEQVTSMGTGGAGSGGGTTQQLTDFWY